MAGGLYSVGNKNSDTSLDLARVKPYGDTMNDGKIQLSFTLPLAHDERSVAAAAQLAEKMGLQDPQVVFHQSLAPQFTLFVVYGTCGHTVDYTAIKVHAVENKVMNMAETNTFIRDQIGRKIVIVGASTGTDAHTVGIDAIMNMKGYAGHYGLERYEMIEAFNLGSQVLNEEFVTKAIELKADVLLVSQTVTQRNVHLQNLSELVELLEAEKLRDKVVLICGGSRITHEMAKELGYDAGFGPGKYADDVASFAVNDIVRRKLAHCTR